MTLEEIRSKLLTSPPTPSVPVTYRGIDLEVLRPSYDTIQELEKEKEKLGNIIATLRLIVRCTVYKGTEKRVYNLADMDVLKALPVGDLDPIQKAIEQVMKELNAKIEGNAPLSPVSGSST